MYNPKALTNLEEISEALEFYLGYYGQTVQTIRDANLGVELDLFLAFLLRRVEEQEAQAQAEDSYW